jgi:hypothetical protein
MARRYRNWMVHCLARRRAAVVSDVQLARAHELCDTCSAHGSERAMAYQSNLPQPWGLLLQLPRASPRQVRAASTQPYTHGARLFFSFSSVEWLDGLGEIITEFVVVPKLGSEDLNLRSYAKQTLLGGQLTCSREKIAGDSNEENWWLPLLSVECHTLEWSCISITLCSAGW